MGQGYLIDTNVIIDNFGNKLPEKARALLYPVDLTIKIVKPSFWVSLGKLASVLEAVA